jgi:hypothetical protein
VGNGLRKYGMNVWITESSMLHMGETQSATSGESFCLYVYIDICIYVYKCVHKHISTYICGQKYVDICANILKYVTYGGNTISYIR